MDELLEKWKFTPQVAEELKQCGVTFDTLINLVSDDFQYMKTNLTSNTVDRLLNCVEKKKIEERQLLESPSFVDLPKQSLADEYDSDTEPLNHYQNIRCDRNNNKDADSDSSININEPDYSPPRKVRIISKTNVEPATTRYLTNSTHASDSSSGYFPKTVINESETASTKYYLRGRKIPVNATASGPKETFTRTGLSQAQKSVHATRVEPQAHRFSAPICSTSAAYCSAFRLNENTVSVNTVKLIIEDSLEGRLILSNYEKEEVLSSSQRELLTSLIINRCGPQLEKPVYKFFEKVADAINKIFPNEKKSTYCIPPHAEGNSLKNAKGKLPDKWRNLNYKIDTVDRRLNANESTDDSSDSDDELPVPENDEIKAQKEWLKINDKPAVQVLSYWDKTYPLRIIELKCNSFEDIFSKDWPLLKTPLGPELIELDFMTAHPNVTLSIERNWENVFNALYSLRNSNIRDLRGKGLLHDYNRLSDDVRGSGIITSNNKVVLDAYRLLLLPYLLPSRGFIKTGVGMKKPSYQESSDGFVIWVKDTRDIPEKLLLRASRYADLKLKVQPVILIVSKQLKNVDCCYVSLHDKLWEVQQPARALDVTFKLLMLMNLAYPEDCSHIWFLIQKCVYKLSTVHDKAMPSVNQLISDIENKLKR